MANIIMVYASMSGNTEEMADQIAEGIRLAGGNLIIKDVMEVDPVDLQEFDGILLGSYTWGDGDLPDEFLDFYDEMDDVDLEGKNVAVFGSCDSCYPHYGAAVDTLVEKVKELGARVIVEGLKIDLSPTEDEKEDCRNFGKIFTKELIN